MVRARPDRARGRAADQRAQRGAEREELLAPLEELAAWYRDLVVVAVGAERVVHADRLDAAARGRARGLGAAAERAAEPAGCLALAEEFNVNARSRSRRCSSGLRQAFVGSLVA